MESDSGAFAILYAESYRIIEGYVRGRVNDPGVAEELVGETFAIAWAKHRDGTVVTVGWLLKTARNLIGNEYRRRVRSREGFANAAMEHRAVLESEDDAERHADLRSAVMRLRPADRLVLYLTYWEGLPAAEAAGYLECSTAALWVRLTRARAALRRALEDPEPRHEPRTETGKGATHGQR
ncbi:sigma-70 family RNA polymerase sigma factor [Leucobacter weissii]|uniref:Sigma-70 family RNA polymerase sigma factor n=1 Tax=Leucobacter weissii TaxID=1983706 RepID=A0A939MIF2_9MICO|nr:sigma-70 family RNA polymerase sigma factor [Leucobacter weissii]